MKKFCFKSLFVFLAFIMILAGCGAADETPADPEGDAGDTEAPVATEGGDLVIANLSDAVSLDPQGSNDSPSSNVATNIYDSLVTHDENLELQPSLATEWELIEDTVWEFKLREGVTFHDGSDFNAEVVKANFERVLDPDVASPRSFLYDMISSVEVVDDYTVHFTTEFPFSPLPANLAHSGGGIISLESINADYAAMEEGKDPSSVIGQNPVGTGPFVFDEWVPGQYIRLVRNDDYWGETAKLDSVTFKVVPEDLTRVAELETGDSHIIYPLSPSDVSRVEGTDGMHVDRTDSLSVSYIGFNAEKEPFDDPKVRKALSMAIDKDGIINGILDGVGIPATGAIAPDVFGYSEGVEALEYDVDQAKQLLAEAGYADGFSTTIWTNDNRERMDIAEYVQNQLKQIGVEVSIEVLEWGAYLEQTANAEHDMFILGWVTVTADADYTMYPLFHSDNVGSAGNRTFLRNDELDELIMQARQEGDQDVRVDLYRQIQEILTEEAPMMYTHHQQYLAGVRDEVQGFWQHPNGMFQLSNVTMEQ